MKRYLLGLLLALSPALAHAQISTQQACKNSGQAIACTGHGSPTGLCTGSFTYADISQTPAQSYVCSAGVSAPGIRGPSSASP